MSDLPTSGIRCQVCGSHQYGSGTPSLVEGLVLARCQGRCGRMTAHRKVGDFDPIPRVRVEGDRRKERGMTLAASTEPDWSAAADSAIDALAATGTGFTADDVTARVGVPIHFNAIGPRFAVASRRGIIRQIGWRKAAGRASQQSRRLAVWSGTQVAWK